MTFIVNRDGAINKHIDVKTASIDIEQNLVQVIKNMPKWIPGKRDGTAVSVQIRLSFLMKDMLIFKTSMSSEIYRIEIKD